MHTHIIYVILIILVLIISNVEDQRLPITTRQRCGPFKLYETKKNPISECDNESKSLDLTTPLVLTNWTAELTARTATTASSQPSL